MGSIKKFHHFVVVVLLLGHLLESLAEQHQIVKKVDEMMALCTQLEARLASTTNTRSKLMHAALNQALNGCEFRPIPSTK
jgi:type I restriction enzyme S subunit